VELERLFNAYSYFDFDYEEKPGSDAIRIQYNLDYASRIDLAASVNSDTSITAATMYVFNAKGFDIQFLAGLYRSDDFAAGTGFTGNLFKGSLRGEAAYFHPTEKIADTTGVYSISLGYDYVFKNSIMAQCDVLFKNSAPKQSNFNIANFYTMNLSAKNLWFSRFAVFAMMAYPVSPLINLSLSAMYSPTQNFVFAGPSISFSMADNFAIDLNVQTFYSDIPRAEGGRGSYAFLREDGVFRSALKYLERCGERIAEPCLECLEYLSGIK
jgi:hypothetical protein